MIELTGKYNTCKVFTDIVENEVISQLITLLNQSFVKNSKIRIMPDVHAGAGCVIGTTMTLYDKAVPNLVGVDIGCTDKDTEVLTPNGWIKISEYNGENILVYDKIKDAAFFDKPCAYIKAPCDTFYHFKSDKNLDQMLSAEHKMLIWRGYKTKGYKQEIKLAKEAFDEHNQNTKSNRAIKTTFDLKNQPLPLSDNMIRIIVMVSADGHIKTLANKEQYITLHFLKQRKIERAQELLSKENIPYKISTIQDNSTNIYFHPPINIDKTLTQFFHASKEQLKIITEEIYYWDGTIDEIRNHKNFSSTNKTNADLIQFAHAANGIRAGINTPANPENRPNWHQTYNVYEANNQYVGFPNYQLQTVPSSDGYKYCFTTSTGFFVMRRNNCISITGNCGMLTVKLKEKESDIDMMRLDKIVRKYVPSGFNVHSSPRHKTPLDCEKLACWKKKNVNINDTLAYRSVGTLGGGNHFIEVNKDSDDNLYLVIHTGSRHLGLEIAHYYQNLAWERFTDIRNNYDFQSKKQELINKLQSENRHSEINAAIWQLYAEYRKDVPVTTKELAYVEGHDFDHYIHDMKMVQEHASANRAAIAAAIITAMGFTEIDRFETIHNYIDTEHMILRKGSVSAQKGERLLIPMNMRDGSLICIGKGNPDWNYSAPHGAGRLMSRRKAKENISMEDFEQSMEGIFTTSVNRSTIDESPFAYKPMESIIQNVGETVNIVDMIKPIYNFKAGD